MSTAYATDLSTVSSEPRATAAWWLAAARALDDLLDRLTRDASVDDGPSGALRQALWTAPHLASHAQRLQREREALRERARLLRRRVSRLAGDPTAVDQVAHELASVAHEESRYAQHSRALIWDSVARDIGGE